MSHYDIQGTKDREKYMICPYDSSHDRILPRRMTYHLTRCRKNYTGEPLGICYFNASHKVPKPELRHHMAICPDKAKVAQLILHESNASGNTLKGNTSLPDYSHSDGIESIENWDRESPIVPRKTHSLVRKPDFWNLVGYHADGRVGNVEEETDDCKFQEQHNNPQVCIIGTTSRRDLYTNFLFMSGVGRGKQAGHSRENRTVGRGRCQRVLDMPGQSLTNGYITEPPNTNGNDDSSHFTRFEDIS